ncbi:hypothetical protein CALVIDRAFT_602456 [Calocera viscosa TUFC12733]|uniref:Uncharacterized protein n=1 Tax=Calocera viscosa (strain TUFC12733) TaxID=1330018 RepID=A0A167H155_CALVF|nr:hypothetical protein CALVIDRAFT_602456 [Calocera viscosa TUFC12733]
MYGGTYQTMKRQCLRLIPRLRMLCLALTYRSGRTGRVCAVCNSARATNQIPTANDQTYSHSTRLPAGQDTNPPQITSLKVHPSCERTSFILHSHSHVPPTMSSGTFTPWSPQLERYLLRTLLAALDDCIIHRHNRGYLSAAINERLSDIDLERNVAPFFKPFPLTFEDSVRYEQASRSWQETTSAAFHAGIVDFSKPVEYFIFGVVTLQMEADRLKVPLDWLKLAANNDGAFYSWSGLIGVHGALAALVIGLIGRPVEDTPPEILPSSLYMRKLMGLNTPDAPQHLVERDVAVMEKAMSMVFSRSEINGHTSMFLPGVDTGYLLFQYWFATVGKRCASVPFGSGNICYCELAMALRQFFGDPDPATRAPEPTVLSANPGASPTPARCIITMEDISTWILTDPEGQTIQPQFCHPMPPDIESAVYVCNNNRQPSTGASQGPLPQPPSILDVHTTYPKMPPQSTTPLAAGHGKALGSPSQQDTEPEQASSVISSPETPLAKHASKRSGTSRGKKLGSSVEIGKGKESAEPGKKRKYEDTCKEGSAPPKKRRSDVSKTRIKHRSVSPKFAVKIEPQTPTLTPWPSLPSSPVLGSPEASSSSHPGGKPQPSSRWPLTEWGAHMLLYLQQRGGGWTTLAPIVRVMPERLPGPRSRSGEAPLEPFSVRFERLRVHFLAKMKTGDKYKYTFICSEDGGMWALKGHVVGDPPEELRQRARAEEKKIRGWCS